MHESEYTTLFGWSNRTHERRERAELYCGYMTATSPLENRSWAWNEYMQGTQHVVVNSGKFFVAERRRPIAWDASPRNTIQS